MQDDRYDLPLKREALKVGIDLTKVYQDFYETLEREDPLYVCVLVRDESPRMFFEIDPEKPGEATCRIFWKKSDITEYINYVTALRNKSDEAKVMMWETKANKIVTSVNISWSRMEDSKKKGLKVVTSTYLDKELIDVETFWTTDQEVMI